MLLMAGRWKEEETQTQLWAEWVSWDFPLSLLCADCCSSLSSHIQSRKGTSYSVVLLGR